MSYTPVQLISVKNNRLIESTDLTKALSNYLLGEHYLVVKKDFKTTCLSIGRMLTSIPAIDTTKSLAQAFTTLFSDSFVARFADDRIPQRLASGLYDRRLAVFNPLTYKNFDVYFTSINTPHIKNDPNLKGYLDDLAIASDEDMSNYLVAVNGVFHRTVLQDKVLFVLDGFRTVRLSGRKDILVVDTRDVGGHTIIPLTKDNVSKPDYQKRAVVTTPTSIQDRSVFAVIDGYFYHRDFKALTVLDKTHVALHTNKMPLIQQFRHNPRTVYREDRFGPEATQTSRKYVDPYEAVFLNKVSVPRAVLANKDFQHSRLTAYHSFLVVMNNPDLFTVTIDITPTGTPRFYFEASTRKISGLLNYGCGLAPSYLIWSDSFERKSIFLSEQDYDVDRQDQSINPLCIPALVRETGEGSLIPAQFFDYVAA